MNPGGWAVAEKQIEFHYCNAYMGVWVGAAEEQSRENMIQKRGGPAKGSIKSA